MRAGTYQAKRIANLSRCIPEVYKWQEHSNVLARNTASGMIVLASACCHTDCNYIASGDAHSWSAGISPPPVLKFHIEFFCELQCILGSTSYFDNPREFANPDYLDCVFFKPNFYIVYKQNPFIFFMGKASIIEFEREYLPKYVY